MMYGYRVYPDQTVTTRLSLAVLLIDDYTGQRPTGRVKVYLEGLEWENAGNRSGYYLFPDLPGSRYRVRVEAEYYFDESAPVNLPDLDSKNPVLQIKLKPKPSYPFPPGSTLIRGMVRDIGENAVHGAVVNVLEKNVNNITNEKGEFVLYFKGLTEEDIDKIGGKRFIKENGGQEVRLKAAVDSRAGYAVLEKVEEGQAALLAQPIILTY